MERALGSLQRQPVSMKLWEAIVAGDGVEPELHGKSLVDTRIRTMRVLPKTGSAGLVRNAAIKEAKGAFVCFLDDDDEIGPDYLRALFINRQADVVVMRMMYPSGVVLPDPANPRLDHGQVGISFAVQRRFFEGKDAVQFIREKELESGGVGNNEDITLLRDLQDRGANIQIADGVHYLVRPSGDP